MKRRRVELNNPPSFPPRVYVCMYIYIREKYINTPPQNPQNPPQKRKKFDRITIYLLPTSYSITVSSNDDFEINTVENDKIDAASGSVWTGL